MIKWLVKDKNMIKNWMINIENDEKIIIKWWKMHKYAWFEEMTGNGNEDESDKHI